MTQALTDLWENNNFKNKLQKLIIEFLKTDDLKIEVLDSIDTHKLRDKVDSWFDVTSKFTDLKNHVSSLISKTAENKKSTEKVAQDLSKILENNETRKKIQILITEYSKSDEFKKYVLELQDAR